MVLNGKYKVFIHDFYGREAGTAKECIVTEK
jgi:hypothetical protein